jgi:Protein of unknown function (DUF2785)
MPPVDERPSMELIELLSSADPHERDEVAYSPLAARVGDGAEDERLALLGDRAVGFLGDDRVYARSFGALLLAEIVGRDNQVGTLDAPPVRRWLAAFTEWYGAEGDLRAWDAELGWLHAIAHGADVIAAFGGSPHLQQAQLVGLLALARHRLLESGDAPFAGLEDERVAYAIARVLARPELTAHECVEWLAPVGAALQTGEPGPVRGWATNTLTTLRALYVFADRGVLAPEDRRPLVVPHRGPVMAAVAGLLRQRFPLLQ